MNIFNYFDELKQSLNLDEKILQNYNIINLSGKILYVEGHCGVIKLQSDCVSFKIKKGTVEVKGDKLSLRTLSENILAIEGVIHKVEVF